MQDVFLGIVQDGFSLNAMWTLVQLMITFFLVLFVKGKVTNYSEYKKIRGNKRIALGSQMSIPTATGSVDMRITSIGFDRVLLEDDKAILNIPVANFASMNKVILKKSPDSSTQEETED